MTKPTAQYAIARTVDLPYDEADRRIRDALKEEGFGILTEIDVKATMKEKLNEDYPPYEILGACNPPLAHQALQAEIDVGLLLPCNVVVRAVDGDRTVIEALDPVIQLAVADNPALAELANEARHRLERAVSSL